MCFSTKDIFEVVEIASSRSSLKASEEASRLATLLLEHLLSNVLLLLLAQCWCCLSCCCYQGLTEWVKEYRRWGEGRRDQCGSCLCDCEWKSDLINRHAVRYSAATSGLLSRRRWLVRIRDDITIHRHMLAVVLKLGIGWQLDRFVHCSLSVSTLLVQRPHHWIGHAKFLLNRQIWCASGSRIATGTIFRNLKFYDVLSAGKD